MVKVISLSNEAYTKLKKIKYDKSFSEVVVELVEGKKARKDFREFAGIFSKDKERWEKIKNKIYEDRKEFKLREAEF